MSDDENMAANNEGTADDLEKVNDISPTFSEEEHHGWKQHAGFSIFFDYKLDERGHKQWHTRVWKTTTYHEESGDVKELDGVETSSWVNWILEKSGLDAEKIPDKLESPFMVDIQHMAVAPSSASRKQASNATINFKVFPVEADVSVPESSIFYIEFNTIRLETGMVASVGQAQAFVEAGKTEYRVNTELPIPQETGRYKLQAAIYWLNEENALAVNDDFIFKVIP